MLRKAVCTIGIILFFLKRKKMPANPSRILIMRSAGIGDVLMSTALVRAIRLAYPNAHITYLVGEWSAPAIKNNPDIDEIITYHDEIIFKKKIAGTIEIIKQIKSKKFEIAIILDKAWEWNMLAFLFGIPFRIGFERKGEGFANNFNVVFEGKKYELEYYRDIANLAGAKNAPKHMYMYPKPADIKKIQKILSKHKINPKKLIVISPGGAKNPGQELAEKRWPAQNYAKVADLLIQKKYSVVLLGGKTDKEINKKVLQNMKRKPALNIAGELSLSESAALLSKSRLMITHDSGPMHLGAAMNTTIVAIFGPTDPKRFAPQNANIAMDKTAIKPSYDMYGNLQKHEGNLEKLSVKTVMLTVNQALKK